MYTNFVELLFNNLMELLPFKIIRSYERGVKFTFGNVGTFRQWFMCKFKHQNYSPSQLEPGLHLALPLIQDIEVVNIVPEVINLPNQTAITKDNLTITYSANIEYHVVDAVKKFCNVQDFENSLLNTCMNILAREVRRRVYKSLVDQQDAIEDSVQKKLNQKTQEWGVEVTSVGITDITQTRAYRFFGEPITTVIK